MSRKSDQVLTKAVMGQIEEVFDKAISEYSKDIPNFKRVYSELKIPKTEVIRKLSKYRDKKWFDSFQLLELFLVLFDGVAPYLKVREKLLEYFSPLEILGFEKVEGFQSFYILIGQKDIYRMRKLSNLFEFYDEYGMPGKERYYKILFIEKFYTMDCGDFIDIVNMIKRFESHNPSSISKLVRFVKTI